MISWFRLGAAVAISVPLLAGCSSAKPRHTVTVTVTPTRSTSAGAAPTASASSGASPGATATTVTKLNGTCDTLLPDSSVTAAIGGKQLAGNDAFIVGQAEKDIGRISYLNCRYGVTGSGAAAKPKVEIGVSLYMTAAQAATRISATTDDYTAHGAKPTHVTVAGQPASVLIGGVGAGYAAPLLVVAAGQRTVAVSIDASVATGAAASKDATALATLAVKQTAA